MKQDNLTALKKDVEGAWEGRRGGSNITTIAFTLISAASLFGVSQMEITERPDDVAHGDFLKNNFAETIQLGIQNLNQRMYLLPDHLRQSAVLYAEHLNTQRDIQSRHGNGERDFSIAMSDVSNSELLLRARTMFRQGMYNDGAGDLVVNAIRCEAGESSNSYDCQMVRAEIGGFDSNGGLNACSRMRETFTVFADENGSIDYISTTGAGYLTEFEIDPEQYNGQDRNPIIDNIVAHVTGSFTYYAARDYRDERNVVLRYSGCLAGGPQ